MRSDHCSSAYVGGSVPVFTNAFNQFILKYFPNLLDNGYCNLGDLVLTSNIECFGYGNTAIDNALSTICGGDPSLELWTDSQNTFDGIDFSINGNTLTIAANSIQNFNVNIADEDGLLIGKYTSTGNTVSIPINENCDISINKHNYVPYVVHIDSENQYIQNTTISENTIFTNTPIFIGRSVTTSIPFGNVTIEPDATVIIKKGSGVTIKNGFECKSGAEFIIK